MRTFNSQGIIDADIDQIVLIKSTDGQGNPVIRVRSNVTVKLVDTVDSTRVATIELHINNTAQELGIGSQMLAIRSAVLSELKKQLN